jgi:GNAT superfamily N-acetyltransferase
MTDFTIAEVPVPTSLDADGAEDFAAVLEVSNLVYAIGFGTDDLSERPPEALPHFQDKERPQRILAARVDDRIVGVAFYETTLGDDADSGWLSVAVLDEFRNRGIGSALAQRIEEWAIADGKTKALCFTPIPSGSGEQMASPTGFGSITLNSDARFLLSKSYRLEQVERLSRLPLPVVDIDAQVIAAQEASGADYALHSWEGAAPDRWREDIAVLATRMSTDAPSAGLEEPEDVWTAVRVAEADERAAASPRVRFEMVVEHVPSGRLVGFTMLSVPPQSDRAVTQWATLVLREHRGHKLGMLLKVANIARLQRLSPGHPSILTFNAEENRHMLNVNEQVGFVGIAAESAWRKDLAWCAGPNPSREYSNLYSREETRASVDDAVLPER